MGLIILLVRVGAVVLLVWLIYRVFIRGPQLKRAEERKIRQKTGGRGKIIEAEYETVEEENDK